MSEASTKSLIEYQNKKLTRQSMENVLVMGGSVLVDGKLITHASNLPDSIDIATTPSDLSKAEVEVAAQEAAIVAKREKLEAAKQTIGTEEKPVVEEEPPVEEPTFGDNHLPLSHFKGKDVDEILEMGEPGIGRRKAERIVSKLEEANEA